MANWLQPTKEGPLTTGDAMGERFTTRIDNESVIGAGFTIEGKIKGDGDIRIGGNFKGDVQVNGNLTIEPGADIGGEIVADNVTIAGKIDGNVTASNQVKLLETCKLVGDLKASSLTVVAGSRMRGMVEFGWDQQEETKVTELKKFVNDEAEG